MAIKSLLQFESRYSLASRNFAAVASASRKGFCAPVDQHDPSLHRDGHEKQSNKCRFFLLLFVPIVLRWFFFAQFDFCYLINGRSACKILFF